MKRRGAAWAWVLGAALTGCGGSSGNASSSGNTNAGGPGTNGGGNTNSGGASSGAAGSGVGDGGAGSLSVWTASAARKIQPTAAPSTDTSVTVETARDAYVGAQIGVLAAGGVLRGVTATPGDLSDGAGHTIAASEITLFFESTIDFTSVSADIGTGNQPVPASSPTHDGRLPDPLVPLVDPYSGANAGQPFDVGLGLTQGLFVDVHVPKGLAAGAYTGTIHVAATEGGSADVSISVTVWNLDLPDMRTVSTHFKMGINDLVRYHQGLQSCSGSDCYEDFSLPHAKDVLHRYEDLAHAHRIDIGEGLVNIPSGTCTPPSDGDWSAYDAAMAPYMDGSAFSDGVPSGRYDTPFNPGQSFGPDAMCSESDYVALAKAWADHLTTKGWFPKPAGGGFGPVVYAYDEPLAAASDAATVDAILNQIVRDSGRLQSANAAWKGQIIDTTSPIAPPAMPSTSPLLDGSLGVYVVAPVLYDDFWDHGAFFGREAWKGLFAQGLQMWIYEGNSILPPYATFATNTIDALEPVMLMWSSWFEHATGFLYYDIALWDQTDPWGPEIGFGKTGDGVMIYPGNHDGTAAPIGSPASVAIDGPIASYRLKMIRQGLEDWALFAYAEQLGQRSFVESQVSTVYTQFGAAGPAPAGMPYWTTDDAKMAAIRKAVALKVIGM